MTLRLPAGVQINAALYPRFEEILTYDALETLAILHRKFEIERQHLLKKRVERQKIIDDGEIPNFIPETKHIREGDWQISPLPLKLECRRTEITGPVERKMIINALNSGADSYMADFEDANSPTWFNQIQGQINIFDAVRHNISYVDRISGKIYQLNSKIANLQIRVRGLHLEEKHILVDGQRVAGGLLDFWLSFFHNAKEQIARGAGPFYYLPKMESYLEARMWNNIFLTAQDMINIPYSTIKATVLIETILAAFEMEEILYELRQHSAGLNAGRWDYIFSCIKKFKMRKNFCFADRSEIHMEVPFMRAYALQLVKICHKHGAPAIGGMSALIPIKNDSLANEKALLGVRRDKARDAQDGFDGGWIAHPGLVKIAHEEFTKILVDKPNQLSKRLENLSVSNKDLINFGPEQPITELGLRNNINVCIHYLGSWLSGNGCVPINNMMEDAATAEISRSQIWQWITSPKGIISNDGRRITPELVSKFIDEELIKVKEITNAQGQYENQAYYERAASILSKMTQEPSYPEFITVPLYEEI